MNKLSDEMIEMEERELFQLSNGKYIMDPAQSEKLFRIKEAKPEESHPMSGTAYSWNEAGMAELFAECYMNDTRYCPEFRSWFTYDNGAWKRDVDNLLVAEKIKEFCRLMSIYCGEIHNEEQRSKYMNFVSKMGDRRFRDRIRLDAASVMPVHGAEFDTNPWLLNCLNGTYDLEHMSFRPHDWRDMCTMQTNFEYTLQEGTKCERWERFVDEVTCGDKDKAEYLQKALGYSLLGVSNEECMFIMHGKTTRNGKSTMLAAIQHMLGSYAGTTPPTIICKNTAPKNAEAASPEMAELQGKRFVTMSESNQSGRMDEEVLKRLTGGEPIKARKLYADPITFTPQFTLWLSCNDLPSVNDKSLFASDRVRVIEFNRHFSEDEQDKGLKTAFQEPEAMKGIFSWLLEGFFLYRRFGLKMSPEMRSVVKQYERDNDLCLQFLEDKCEKEDGIFTRAKTLYDSYKIWCKSNGYFVCSAKKFNAEMASHCDWHGGMIPHGGAPCYANIKMKG